MMLADDKVTSLHKESPAPLEFFEVELVHPENIRLEAAIKRSRPMGFWESIFVTHEARRLNRRLRRKGYNQLITEFTQVKQDYEDAVSNCRDIQAQMRLANEVDDNNEAEIEQLRSALNGLMKQLESLRTEGERLKAKIKSLLPLVKRLRYLVKRIDWHNELLERKSLEREEYSKMSKEADWIEELILDTWRKLDNCHHYWEDNTGNGHWELPSFQKVDITPDAHHFKIEASAKGIFNWHNQLPTGVYVDNLLAEKTLANISAVCGRQVEAVRNHNGLWLKVNRLDSPDGLLNYVTYKNVMEYYPEYAHDLMPFPAGVVVNRRIRWINFSEWPHSLIAGFTQSGKSNFVNCIVSTLITKHSPKQVRIVFIDMKGQLEFGHYDGVPHQLGDIVSNVQDMVVRLSQVKTLMYDRFEQLREDRAKNIEVYNKRKGENERLSRIVIFVDEMQSILGHGSLTHEAHGLLAELTAMGRAVGIHCVLCTQHPSVKTIPGPIKTNCAVRVAGRMPTSSSSVTALGVAVAKEIAPIAGRMMIMLGPDPEEVQTPHITDNDVADAFRFAQTWGETDGLELPDEAAFRPEQWTPERVLKFAVDHLQCKLTGSALWRAVKDERTLSNRQVYKLIEQCWAMFDDGPIEIDGTFYELTNPRGKEKLLVEVEVDQAESAA